MGNLIKREQSQEDLSEPQNMDNILCGADEVIKVPEVGVGQWIYQSFQKLDRDFEILIESISGESITVGELLEKCSSLVSSLSDMGVAKGDRIAIIGENTIKLCISGFATWFLGAVMCPIDPTLKSREFQHILGILQPKVIFCDQDNLTEVQDAVNKLGLELHLIGVHTEGKGDVTNMDDLLGKEVEELTPAVIVDTREELAVIVWSSGTTGMPKGVAISHFGLTFQTVILGSSWSAGKVLHTSFFYWISGIMMFTGTSVNGVPRILVKSADPLAVIQAIHRCKPMMCFMSPSLLSSILFHPKIHEYDVSSLETVSVGGAPLTQALLEKFREELPLATLRQGYGCSEISGVATWTAPQIDILSLGKPVSQTQIKVVDVNTGEVLKPEEEGEILIKSPSLMKEYIDNPSATQNAIDSEGWYHTGDLGRYTSEGVLYITGRMKELLKVDGHQISPEEIEVVIAGMQGVVDVAVAGILVEENNLPMALVVKFDNSNIVEEDIIKTVEENLSEFKQLRAGVRFVNNIPRTSTGKVKRREVQSLAEQLYN